ncbi:gamma-tubulin complex component 6-like protein [Lasius niger]|uniref:Gamma-tubulin complex component 6-like protein n=1 Tax=Lasius niger TaxID=67767 RepID=A0A0J7L2N7_LASNI|nr:gamma-tubulin complex component 6-like protein [Lasius niger]
MDLERNDANIYGLVTQLVEHTLRKYRLENGNSYTPPRNDIKIVRGFRSKAYEILLNKSKKVYSQEKVANSEIDPLVEILKYAFVLKLSLRRVSEAEKLENLINELYINTVNVETVIKPILKLLLELKNFQTDTGTELDVFHYGKTNPFLPEDVTSTNGVPMFQTYPVESFILPEKFEAVLGIRKTSTRRDRHALANFVSRMSFEDQHISKTVVGIETIRYNNAIEMAPCISSCTESTAKPHNMFTPFSTSIMVEQTNMLYSSTQRFISNVTLPCEWIKSVDYQKENRLCVTHVSDNSNSNFMDGSEDIRNINLIWKDIQVFNDYVSKLRTWESFGASESSKQLLFVTDLPETMLHLARIRQTSILSLLPKKAMHSISLMQEISPQKFSSDVKLLLFGIDSDSFKYNTVIGFKLEENISVHGINSETLKITCQEAICWGNSFKSLLLLVTPDPQTGKLQQNGLIFKNPVCNVSFNAPPEVRVCLSVSMLREQLLRCQEYKRDGEAALGPIVSLLSAIRDEKKAERETAELVIRAQQETLSRLNEQRKELIAKAAQSKRELLQELKHQAEESALFKEKKKEIEMLADKLLLEKLDREQEEIREQQQAEREHLINYYDKLTVDVESNRIRSNWRKMRMSHFERRVEHLKSTKKFDREISASVATPSSDENIINTNERNENIPISPSTGVSTSEVEVVSSQDENSNFSENEILNVAMIEISNRNDTKEDLSAAKSVSSDISSSNTDKDIVSDVEEITTSKDSLITVDTQNVHLPQESLPLNYIYKKNNERSNLQDFLRDEAMKNIRTIINDKQMAAVDTRLNILENDEITEKLVGTINRPKSLAIERIDNMTVAQTNKLKVLLQEYGMTPNNNELSTILADKQGNVNRTNINGNNKVTNEQNLGNTKESVNNNVSPTPDIKLPEEEMTNSDGPMNNEECSNKINDANVKEQDLILNNMQRQNNNMDTPMSCTTDNFTTLSTHTPLSQIPNSDDIFALNGGQESSLSDMTKSIMTEETCFESPMSGNFKLPNLFGVIGSDVKSSPVVSPSSLTIADVEMIDHTSLQVYLEKSIIIPLQIQTRLVNNAIIKYLVNECDMLLHLHSLRSYFFLLNGEFAKSLTDSLYSRLYTISAPIELFNSATLTNLLEKALMNSFSNNYANSELLSLSAIDQPCQLYISDPNVLECLCLNYKIAWPLNIILDDTMMLQYSKVFKFLIMTGRMSWVLQEDFNIMKIERNVVNSQQYHKVNQLMNCY